jgi:hypothetical protein
MSFNLSFNISESTDCKTAVLCDTTNQIEHYNKYTCSDGYGAEGNISLDDISYTRFNWKLPDGSEFLDINMYWEPGTYSRFRFQVTGGTNGVFVVSVNSVVVGQQYFVTDIATTIELLIQNINTLATRTGWQAYLQAGSTDIIVVESINLGEENNDLPFDVTVSGDIAVNLIGGDPVNTFGSNGNQHTLSFTMDDIMSIIPSTKHNDFPDGVYEVTYILYNDADEEIGRSTINVLFTCLLKCIIRKLILLPAEDKCACSDKFDKRLVELRLMLEKAEIQMDDCLFDCTNETILLAHKMAKGICLDC